MFVKAIVVDDDRASAAATAKLLGKAGCAVSVCTEAGPALAAVLDEDPDLVALDLAMPDIDGYEMLHLIRSHEHTRRAPSVPVIAVTGKVTADDRSATLAAGFAAHIGKPVLLDELKRCLATVYALRGALYRTRYSIDQAAIAERLRQLLAHRPGERLLTVAGLAMSLEQQGKDERLRLLHDAHRGAVDAATACSRRLAALGGVFGAAHLVELCGALRDALHAGVTAFEPAAVLVRAELDRVIFTLREEVLGQA